MRAWCRLPRTVVPPRMPGPSKRISFLASVLDTYTFPVAGFTAMSNRIVPTWGNAAIWTGVGAMASMAKTSRSGRVKRTALRQSRPIGSRQAPVARSNLTTRPVSGPTRPSTFRLGAGSPPGMATPPTVQGGASVPPSHTAPSVTVVVWLPEWNTAA